jgi:hypothetical protein
MVSMEAQWISFDNELKLLNEKIKQLRNKKDELEERLFAKHPNNSLVKVGDGTLKFTHVKTATPLTFKYLEKSLGEIIKNEVQCKQIITHIKSQREITLVPEIKRVRQ